MQLLLFLTIWCGVAWKSQGEPPTENEQRATWASPSQFRQLPAPFVKELEARGCKIPQASTSSLNATNVIHGHIGSTKQTDWVVVCKINNKSVLLFFWGGPEHCAPETNVQEGDGHERVISMATPRDIQKLLYDEKQLPPVAIHHDGIWDVYADKDGTLDYCDGGRWIHHINGGH
jgi:hypothetical protein